MARGWLRQIRPLLVVWLLVTVPVVCHHPTAEFLLGSLIDYLTASGHHAPTGLAHLGHSHVHGAAAPDEPVGLAASDVPPAPAYAPHASGDDARPAWYAHHPSERVRVLPEGQGSVALLSALDVSLGLAWAPAPPPLCAERPADLALAPPAPPPRPLA
ncbi:MAG TPA: hypothetical protein VKZ60_07270 [Chloroflexota bacterium]|jgi:hypothetical protein|nr:hypothetical protein [Chloroflexota bacterium]